MHQQGAKAASDLSASALLNERGKLSGDDLCGRTAVVQRISKDVFGKNRGGGNNSSFNETGDDIRCHRSLIGCGLMMAYDADRAVVVIGCILVGMLQRHEGGYE